MNNYIYRLIMVLTMAGFALSVSAQQRIPVSGRVTDTGGNAVVGVTVFEEGSSNGTNTDGNGEFRLTVSGPQSILSFSFVGYIKQSRTVGNTTRFNITLEEDIEEIEEVVVVGYGVQRKASVVGAISTTEATDLQKTGTTNLTQALGGRVSGVFTKNTGGRPGEDDAKVWIRGRATFNTGSGETDPLVLVDGIERDYAQIDPEDIENFSVLKDASATAVYGVRGANGVILITTKRGETAKPSVDFRASVNLSEPTRLPKRLGSYDYARLMNEALTNVGQNPEYSAVEFLT